MAGVLKSDNVWKPNLDQKITAWLPHRQRYRPIFFAVGSFCSGKPHFWKFHMVVQYYINLFPLHSKDFFNFSDTIG